METPNSDLPTPASDTNDPSDTTIDSNDPPFHDLYVEPDDGVVEQLSEHPSDPPEGSGLRSSERLHPAEEEVLRELHAGTPANSDVSKTSKNRPRTLRHDRKIPFYFRRDELSVDIFHLIYKRWCSDMSIDRIVKAVNVLRAQEKQPPLKIHDVYAVIGVAIKKKSATVDGKPIRQRRTTRATELVVKDFVIFYETWRRGGRYNDCVQAVKPFNNGYFLKKCFRQLMERWREVQKEDHHETEKRKARAVSREIEQTFFKHAVRQMVEGRMCIIVPVRVLPVHIVAVLDAIPVMRLADRETLTTQNPVTCPSSPLLEEVLSGNLPVKILEPPAELVDEKARFQSYQQPIEPVEMAKPVEPEPNHDPFVSSGNMGNILAEPSGPEKQEADEVQELDWSDLGITDDTPAKSPSQPRIPDFDPTQDRRRVAKEHIRE